MMVEPVVLRGRVVSLEPLASRHVAGLWEAGRDPEIWRFLPALPRSPEDVETMVGRAVAMSAAGTGLGFALMENASSRVIGSSGYWNLAPEHARLEIGMTWITPQCQRTAANTEMKLLMLQQAFEVVGCARVEFKTDRLNQRSRQALARIGAVEEGTLRSHMQYPGGRRRDTVYFSILRDEWDRVRQHLETLLATG